MANLISVIIPTYNRAHILADTLLSVQNQSFTNWECLIVDDGSSDNTEALANNFAANDKRFRFLSRPATMQKGANSCRNFGLKQANGDLIKWLDSDDILQQECISKQLSVIAEYDVCFCQANFFTKEYGQINFIPNRVWGKLFPERSLAVVDSYLLKGTRWQTACGLWKRPFLPEKPFLEGLQNSQEWLMHLNMLLLKPRIRFLDENLCHIRSHTGSMSNAKHKKSNYYYHQCWSRIEAMKALSEQKNLTMPIFKKIVRFILWNHLFIFYSGSIVKGLSFCTRYPRIFTYLRALESTGNGTHSA
jgi:glycosyltransferase involved in cell wall biosynthesis